MHELRLHIIPLTNEELDTNGDPVKPYDVTPMEFAQLIDRVNLIFADTGIRFLFYPAHDWAPMANTEINTDGPRQRELANRIAARLPGKIVCFLRWGPGRDRTGNGNTFPPPGAGPKPPSVGDVVQNYVALPNRIAADFGLLIQGDGGFVAHELGHYLGLYHTFPGWTDR
ncbi:hypothetical protein [Nocardia sp. bgisy134]|uniref:hypothetical protein n=1 Tax=Nocardia sp. bgisy134 TaxID=3413789 RepID=UPI003D72A82F